jgi:threonine/homoserine/homoserine lactone efflux protein
MDPLPVQGIQMIVFNGIKLGIVLAFLIGPVFFTIIQTSVERGFGKGVLVSIGVSLSDLFYVVICCLGLIRLVENAAFHQQMAYVGGGILLLFGLYYLLVKNRKIRNTDSAHIEPRSRIRYLLKGFVINAFSPMVPLFWIGTLSIVTIDFGYNDNREIIIFYAAVLVTVLGTDILKAWLAGRLRRLITLERMKVINVIVGIALIIFGVRLLMLGSMTG